MSVHVDGICQYPKAIRPADRLVSGGQARLRRDADRDRCHPRGGDVRVDERCKRRRTADRRSAGEGAGRRHLHPVRGFGDPGARRYRLHVGNTTCTCISGGPRQPRRSSEEAGTTVDCSPIASACRSLTRQGANDDHADRDCLRHCGHHAERCAAQARPGPARQGRIRRSATAMHLFGDGRPGDPPGQRAVRARGRARRPGRGARPQQRRAGRVLPRRAAGRRDLRAGQLPAGRRRDRLRAADTGAVAVCCDERARAAWWTPPAAGARPRTGHHHRRRGDPWTCSPPRPTLRRRPPSPTRHAAFIMYTSGTTGPPEGRRAHPPQPVLHAFSPDRHTSACTARRRVLAVRGAAVPHRRRGRACSRCLLTGGTTVIPPSGGFDPAATLDAARARAGHVLLLRAGPVGRPICACAGPRDRATCRRCAGLGGARRPHRRRCCAR